MTSVFDDQRADPDSPVALSPRAAQDGGPDSEGGGLGVDFWISLGASLGSLVNDMRADRDAAANSAPDMPADVPLYDVGTVPAGKTTVTLDLGAVPQGRVWQVRRMIVGGTTVTTTAAGSAYLFARGAPPADLALSDCVDIFSTLPQGNTYGTHQLYLLPGEHLWVVFTGATAAQQYAAAARVEEWSQDTFAATFVE